MDFLQRVGMPKFTATTSVSYFCDITSRFFLKKSMNPIHIIIMFHPIVLKSYNGLALLYGLLWKTLLLKIDIYLSVLLPIQCYLFCLNDVQRKQLFHRLIPSSSSDQALGKSTACLLLNKLQE